ncbi:hypothetical protein PRZ48_006358 [Zasmidium cellare]|uniref:Zn(2)-C6 fungal-type domain-containing protein n=1 Tax=Zasmidium cellare TaxID=395010 RepID=A0ABR0ENU4_ZASCE|nr:hypothetical protein PRZ48_006358 [Zasmidium cellare]
MSGDSSSSKGTLLLDNVAKAKRSQVTAACQNCRRKKVKCDGRRPCSDCSRRGIHCEYVAQENETPQQALKRKFDDLTRIYEGLASQDEDQAIETLRRIRAGHQVESILRHVSQREDEPELERHRRLFLTALAQSTAALDDILDVASTVLLDVSTRLNLPLSPRYESLKNKLVTMGDLYNILPNAPTRGLPPPLADGTVD